MRRQQSCTIWCASKKFFDHMSWPQGSFHSMFEHLMLLHARSCVSLPHVACSPSQGGSLADTASWLQAISILLTRVSTRMVH